MRAYFSRPLPHLILLLICIAVFMVCISLINGLLLPMLEVSFTDFIEDGIRSKEGIYCMLAVQDIALFLLPAFVAMRMVRRNVTVRLGLQRKAGWNSILYAALLILSIIPFINLTANINALIPMPQWAIDMEQSTTEITETLLNTDEWGYFALNLLFVVTLPTIVEEIFFRGFVQNLLHCQLKNVHGAICLTAVVFSVFHLQFVSFLPRLVQGVVLGYLFYWSGSLWLSIAAHWVNNALVVCFYFYAASFNLSLSSIDAINDYFVISIVSALIGGFLMAYIYQIEQRRKRYRFIIRT